MVAKKSKQARRKQRVVKAISSPYSLIDKQAKPEARGIALSLYHDTEMEFRNKHKSILLQSQVMNLARAAVKKANALYANFQKSITVVEDFKKFNENSVIHMTLCFAPKDYPGMSDCDVIKADRNTVNWLRNLRINSPKMWKHLLDMINEAKK